ncbi:MAG: excinuclease ABC subunit UvrB [Phycisphaerales bacterium]
MNDRFSIVSDFAPTGDQPQAIDALVTGLEQGQRHNVLLGATGTGKTFTMANVIERTNRPALILSHNKTLAAQLYEEMKELFPDSAVCYFVSYYDYYQPEAYIPQRDIYIEKDASRNDDLDRLRLQSTSSLLSRRDTIVVASVSCIYGLGSPEAYRDRVLTLTVGDVVDRRKLLLGLADMQYARTDLTLERGQFRARGDTIEVHPAYEQHAVRVELFGDEIDRIQLIHPVSGEALAEDNNAFIFPAVHYVLPEQQMQDALGRIRSELDLRVGELRGEGKLLEAQRLLARTKYDLEMIEEVGYCSGVENYSAPLEGRPRGSRPHCMMDYFRYVPGCEPDDWLLFIDESHVTLPQIRAMFNGDQARKKVLIDHGFRLPSSLDNRPLTFDEFEEMVPNVVYVSATPSPYELEKAGGVVAEQVIRPTGLLDPPITVLPTKGQVPDIMAKCRERAERNERTLVTVLTKRLAEDLTAYLDEQELKVRYLHSEIDTLERLQIIRELREGQFDVLVGVNLLREGLDLPEVSLVCIVDADKTGFLRSETSLIQTVGRAARNSGSEVFMYADSVTPQMQAAIDETERRRAKQIAYNEKHGITPTTIHKAIRRGIELELRARRTARDVMSGKEQAEETFDRDQLVVELERAMLDAAQKLEFEKAGRLRDQINELKSMPEGGVVTKKKLAKAGGPKPGQARSRAGITGRGKKKR